MTENPKNTLIETRLRMLSWNIWWRYGPWRERAPAIAATLAEIDADVITLQEVWSDGSTNFASKLAADLGYHHIYAPAEDKGGVFQGNAILSRWPIVRHEILYLYSQKGAEENRVAIFALIDGPRGLLSVFCTHLNWKQHHSHIRQRQVADLARFVALNHTGDFPPVVGCDFNADPRSEEYRMMTGQTTCPVADLVFHDAWPFANPDAPGYTWDNANPFVAAVLEPNRRIDYIFAGWAGPRGAGHIVDCKVAACEPVDGMHPSDHRAVLAELRY